MAALHMHACRKERHCCSEHGHTHSLPPATQRMSFTALSPCCCARDLGVVCAALLVLAVGAVGLYAQVDCQRMPVPELFTAHRADVVLDGVLDALAPLAGLQAFFVRSAVLHVAWIESIDGIGGVAAHIKRRACAQHSPTDRCLAAPFWEESRMSERSSEE
jgi:hypothetical protein